MYTVSNENTVLSTALNTLKADYTAENRLELEKALEELTTENKGNAVAKFSTLSGKELFSALATATDTRTAHSYRQQINCKVYTAVHYAKYVLVGDNVSDLAIKRVYKGITIADIYTAKCNSLAFGHANQKVTKDDKAKAIREILTDGIHELFTLFIDKSAQLTAKEENGKDIYRNENYTNCYRYVEHMLDKDTKHPFENTSKGALQTQIQYIYTALLGDDIGKKFIKKHALRLASAVCNTNRKLTQTIENSFTAYDSFVYLARFVNNGINLPDNDKTDIHNYIKSESLNPDIIK